MEPFVAEIVCSYVRNNHVPPGQISVVIEAVFQSPAALGKPVEPERTPAVPLPESATKNYVSCLNCRWRGLILKPHLRARHGFSEGEYRARWRLAPKHRLTARVYCSLLGLSAFGLALCALATSAAASDRITMRAEVFGPLGVHLSTVRTEIEEMGDQYAISVDYATTGVARLLVNETSHAEARGRLSLGSAQPESFRRDTRTDDAERHNTVRYHGDGTVEGGSTPSPPNPVNLAAADRTVDDVTAYFRLERQLAAKGSCALTVPVFDGRHRYDFVFTDGGRRELLLPGGERLQTIVCHMRRRDLAVPAGESDEGARAATIWYAPVLPSGVWVPVRMELETVIGTTIANLAELKAPGIDWRL